MEALAGYDSDETGSQNKAKAKVETDNTVSEKNKVAVIIGIQYFISFKILVFK